MGIVLFLISLVSPVLALLSPFILLFEGFEYTSSITSNIIEIWANYFS